MICAGHVCYLFNNRIIDSKLPEDNTTKEQWNALKEIRSWKDEVILLADKGNAMVVIEREDYDRKVRDFLDNTSMYLLQTTKGPPHIHSGIKGKQEA